MCYCFMKPWHTHITIHEPSYQLSNTRAHQSQSNQMMWGRDEIGLFKSLYRNMLMQDNDSLIACYYGMYWRSNVRAETEMIVRCIRVNAGPLKSFTVRCGVVGGGILLRRKVRLMSSIAMINILMDILMVLSKHYKSGSIFVLYWYISPGNWWKSCKSP